MVMNMGMLLPMGDGSWWVPTLTAMTALGASWVTSRGTMSGVRVRAEVEAHAKRVTDQRDRRREVYRDLSGNAHALAEVFWRMAEFDRAPGPAERTAMIAEMQAASAVLLNGVTKTSRDVLLEGPANVAEEARQLRRRAVATHRLLTQLVDAPGEHRAEYDRAYAAYRDQHVRFLEVAREALEIS